MDVDSENSEGYEDFHPSNLLEVIVKETESTLPAEKKQDLSPSVFPPNPQPHPVAMRGPVFIHLNEDGDLTTPFLTKQKQRSPKNEDPSKKGESPRYWRVCYLCNTKEAGGKDSKLAYHKFPAETKLCKLWKKACNVDDKDDISNLKICSKHFKADDYVDHRAKQLGGVLKLKHGAIPTVRIPNPMFSTSDTKQYILEACSPPQQPSPDATANSGETTLKSTVLKPLDKETIVQKEKQSKRSPKNSTKANATQSPTSATKEQKSNKAPKEKKDEQASYWRVCFLCDYREPGGKKSKIAFHKFPADVKACKLWKQVCDLTDIDDVSTLKLCSKHFHPEDYIDSRAKELGGYLKLKSGTVPSIDVPSPLSSGNVPTKFYIVTNSSQKSVGSSVSNGTPPTSVLNMPLHDPSAISVVNPEPVSASSLTAHPSNKTPITSSVSNLVGSNQKSIVMPHVKSSKQSSLSKNKSESREGKPVRLLSPKMYALKQPRVVIKPLDMTKDKKLQKGLAEEKNLNKTCATGDLDISKSVATKRSMIDSSRRETGNDTVPEKRVKKDHEKDGEAAKEKGNRRHCILCGEWQRSTKALHRFPSEPNLCKLWRRACNVLMHDSVSALRICSLHFKQADFYDSKQLGNDRQRIKAGVVPSVNLPKSRFRSAKITSLADPQKPVAANTLVDMLVESSSSSVPSERETRKEGISVSDGTVKTMRCCFLCDFKEGTEAQSSVVMHKFPSEKHTNTLWKQACNLYEHDYMNTSSLLLCSNHFTERDYVDGTKKLGVPILKAGAVPSLSVPNPLKTVSLTKLASLEPENFGTVDSVNPFVTMAGSFNAPESPYSPFVPEEIMIKDEVYEPEEDAIDVDSSLAFHSILKPIGNIPDNESDVNNSSTQNLLQNETEKVLPEPMIAQVNQISEPISLLNPVKTEPVDPTDKESSNNMVPYSQQFLNTVNSMAHSALIGNLLHSGQTLKIICNRQQGNDTSQTIQIMPPLKFTGLIVPNQALKKTGDEVDQSNQAQVAAKSTDQSSQTEVEECIVDVVGEDDEIDVDSPPVPKKQCVAVEALPEGFAPKQVKRVITIKRNSHIQMIEQQAKRIKKCINSLEDLLSHLQKRDLLSKDAADTIMCVLGDECQDVISKKLVYKNAGEWPLFVKTFALTLHFYSIEAYKYVKNLWPNLFPDTVMLRSNFSVNDASPGFTREVLDAISLRCKNSDSVLCNVMISEMQIQRDIVYENGRFYGSVDFGTYQDMRNDCRVEAQNVLVFFVADLKRSWRTPVGYFLINTLNAKERANLLTKCLELLHEAGAKVLSITLDGSPVNFSMCSHMGANFVYDKGFQPWFLSPVTREKVLVFWDPCYMVKLVRDCLGDKKVLYNSESKSIKWLFIMFLYKVQSGLKGQVDMKLTEAHLSYQKYRTDEKLSLQTLSQSVYKGFMRVLEKKSTLFKDCSPTADYCLMFNNIFDILNSRNKFSKRKFHVPITDESVASLENHAASFIKYISGLKDSVGNPLLSTNRKTGFLGLIVCLTNIFELFKMAKSFGLTQLFTNKLSLDYVRMFFRAILDTGKKNGFLKAKEFESAYRNLVLKCGINVKRTDCLVDGIELLRVTAQKIHYMYPICDYSDSICLERIDHEYFTAVFSLKLVLGNVVKYISGYVVNKILRKRLCPVCAEHLVGEKISKRSFKREKEKNYTIPSDDVSRICNTAEMAFREIIHKKSVQTDLQFLVTKIFSCVCFSVFNTDKMKSHVFDQGIFDNHMTQLCKLVIETFLEMRIFHENESIHS